MVVAVEEVVGENLVVKLVHSHLEIVKMMDTSDFAASGVVEVAVVVHLW